MVADGHLTPPPPLPGWNAGASFLTKKETPVPDTSFIDVYHQLFRRIHEDKIALKALINHPDLQAIPFNFDQEISFDDAHSECIENIYLTYRHLEDAHLRLGKVVQAYLDGISSNDKETP